MYKQSCFTNKSNARLILFRARERVEGRGGGWWVGLRRTGDVGEVAPGVAGACPATSCSSLFSLSMRGDRRHPIGSLLLVEEPKESKETFCFNACAGERTLVVQKLSCPTNRYFRML